MQEAGDSWLEQRTCDKCGKPMVLLGTLRAFGFRPATAIFRCNGQFSVSETSPFLSYRANSGFGLLTNSSRLTRPSWLSSKYAKSASFSDCAISSNLRDITCLTVGAAPISAECRTASIGSNHAIILPRNANRNPDGIFGKDTLGEPASPVPPDSASRALILGSAS